MANFKDIQNDFRAAIFDSHAGTDFVASSYPAQRLDIYRQTILENLRQALAITYPGIWQLLGNECADSVAYAYLKTDLPGGGCLDDWGDSFAEFLALTPELEKLPYLKDYAAYEWLLHLAYGAVQGEAITPQELEKIPEENIESIKLVFLPTMFLFSSIFPITKIQEVIQNPDASEVNLNEGGMHLMVARIGNEVLTFSLSPDLWLFVQCIKSGMTLGQSTEEVIGKYPDFDLALAIHFLLQKQLVQEIIL